jgi:hypothetical protein
MFSLWKIRYASRVPWTSWNAIRLPGWRHAPHRARRKVSRSHVATGLVAVRHAEDQPAGCSVCCSRVPSPAPSPSTTTGVPAGITPLMRSSKARGRSSGKGPLGAWRTRHARGRARPVEMPWSISAVPPRPTPRPSRTSTTVCQARGRRKTSA